MRRKRRPDEGDGGKIVPAAARTVRSCEGVKRLRMEERREGAKRVSQRERQGKFSWQPCSLFHTKSGARLSVKCLCVPKHHYCLLRQQPREFKLTVSPQGMGRRKKGEEEVWGGGAQEATQQGWEEC